jgi:hypothetical protein
LEPVYWPCTWPEIEPVTPAAAKAGETEADSSAQAAAAA